jgi:hypothetical protein
MRNILLSSVLALGAAFPALANDTTAELKTGGLEFVRTLDISMEEEKLFISPQEVRVDYVFRNTSDKDIETYVAFPMPDITGGLDGDVAAGDTARDNFLDFSVTQDGQAIQAQLQQRVFSAGIDMTDVVATTGIPLNPRGEPAQTALARLPAETIQDWLTRGLIMAETYDDGSGEKTTYLPLWTLKSVYWWKTSFPAGQDIRVSHRYRPSVGGTVATTFLDENNAPKGERFEEYRKKYCIDDSFVRLARKSNEAMSAGKPYLVENWISYVLTTGANWAGPIKRFTLTIDKGEPGNFVSFCGEGVRKTGPTTFEMTATDFYPERDLDILLLVPTGTP